MRFIETPLKGAYLIEPERREDERGFFARTWCRREALAYGLDPTVVQCNLSFNARRGTLRGLHFQLPLLDEAKLVRCARGAVYDVIVDLRPESGTFLQWYAAELTAHNYRMLYVPRRFAHGFLTLEDDTEVFYQMSEYYAPECARGIRWNDPKIGIAWPVESCVISTKDEGYPDVDTGHLGHVMGRRRETEPVVFER